MIVKIQNLITLSWYLNLNAKYAIQSLILQTVRLSQNMWLGNFATFTWA